MIDASILFYPIYGGVLMRSKRIPAEKQYRLIMECRQSGLTDHQWCVEHDIKPGTFYNWVKRLRQKGCMDLPASTGRSYRAPESQEVVTLSVDSPRPRHRADPAQSSAFFLVPKAYIPPSAESADTRCGRSVYPLPAP